MANSSPSRNRVRTRSKRWLYAVRAHLVNAGLTANMRDTLTGLKVQATLHGRSEPPISILVAQDGRIELRFRTAASAPGQVAATIMDAVAAISADRVTNQPFLAAPNGPHRRVAGYDCPVTERAGAGGMSQHPDGPGAPDEPRSMDVGSQGNELGKRLQNVPPGHPSSLYNADGSLKPPVPDPRDREEPIPGDPDYPEPGQADNQTDAAEASHHPAEQSVPSDETDSVLPPEPLTDAEYAERVQMVRERLSQAREDGLTTDRMFTIDPDHEVWTEEREASHDQLIEDLYKRAANVPNDGRAIVAGGLPGAGKTTVLEGYASIDRSQYLTINPDDVKEEMAKRGLIPSLESLTPMEASDLVHEESSHIAKRLARRAEADGKNVIWDITMSKLETTQERILALRSHGYMYIEGVFVDIPPEVSAGRAIARHRSGHEQYRAGDGEGGRLVPEEGILANADPDWGSKNRRIFEQVKSSLDAWSVYDNSVDDRHPVLLEVSRGKGQKWLAR